MIMTGRVIAVLLLIAAAAVTVQDAMAWYNTHVFEPTVIGKLWFQLSPTTLQLAQPALQRHIGPWLWDNVIVFLLQFWAAPTFAVPALLLLWETRGRRRHGTRLE